MLKIVHIYGGKQYILLGESYHIVYYWQKYTF